MAVRLPGSGRRGKDPEPRPRRGRYHIRVPILPPRIVRLLASVRVPSSHGPDVDYEMVHAVVESPADPGATHESVFLRLASGETGRNDLAPEILAADLPALTAQWSRFVADVLWRRSEAGDAGARAALDRIQRPASPPAAAAPEATEVPVISASGGRFGARAQGPAAISAGPRKAPAPAPEPAAPVPEEPKKPLLPDEIQVIGFNFSTPPTAEGLLSALQAQPRHLIVVAPAPIAQLAEDFIADLKSGAVRGQPTTFTPIIVRRSSPKGPVPHRKLRAELAAGIARLLGDLRSALWILPE